MTEKQDHIQKEKLARLKSLASKGVEKSMEEAPSSSSLDTDEGTVNMSPKDFSIFFHQCLPEDRSDFDLILNKFLEIAAVKASKPEKRNTPEKGGFQLTV